MGKIKLSEIVNLPAFEEAGDLFYRATGMTISFYDDNGNVLFYPAEERCDLCHLIQSTTLGAQRCQRSDKSASEKALRSGKPIFYTCHAGLTDLVVPVVVGGERMGCFYSGQSFLTPQTPMGYQELRNKVGDLELDPDELWKAYNRAPIVDGSKLDIAMGLLSVISNHLVEGEIAIRQERKLTREQQRLRKSAEDKAHLERDLREMELKLIQVQMNPHFLFNALNLILGQSMAEDANETAKLVEELAIILRASISSIGSMISLEEEMKNASAYVDIFRARFGHKIGFEFHIPEKFKDIKVPSLILQPLVENALIHALPKCVGAFHLEIIASAQDDSLLIQVSDNGIEIVSEAFADISATIKRSDHGGKLTGLAGVNRRLKYYYPGIDDICIETSSEGFVVAIVIPSTKKK